MAERLEEIEPPVGPIPPSGQVHNQGEAVSSFSLSHLPPIEIPPFSGNYEEWESFRDRFTSLFIQNKDLSAFARMHFLASSLTGRALESIKNIPITADNFDIAWKTLVSRYENKRRLIKVHVSALYNLPNVNRESALELNELRDEANRAIASLKNLDRSADDILSDILVYSVSQKLDNATRKAWKLKGGDDPKIPTYEDLDRFLASRARALEELAPHDATKLTRQQKITSATASKAANLSCPICKSAHFINKCPKFVEKSPSQRLEIVKQSSRCINCLSTKHTIQSCPSKYSCRTCKKKHHSMLHLDSGSSSNNNTVATTIITQSETNTASSITALFSTSELPSRPPAGNGSRESRITRGLFCCRESVTRPRVRNDIYYRAT